MISQTPCQCSACTASRTNGSAVPERPRYFPRQLLTPADLTLEQDYFRDKLRRHNRLLHGWGVVCGAYVCPVPDPKGGFQPWLVSVSTGYLLGPYGDEILIDHLTTVNLQTTGGPPTAENADDPWCTPVYTPRQPGETLYVAVKYAETQTRPVRVQPSGCGCDATACEPSRLCDGFEVGVLETLPASYTPPASTPPGRADFYPAGLPDCLKCPADPWVVLASVVVDPQGVITTIDNVQNRRLVLSFANFWWRSSPAAISVSNATQTRSAVAADGTTTITVAVTGLNFMPGVLVDLGAGIQVTKTELNNAGTQLTVTAVLAKGVTADTLPLTVVNQDCARATFTVLPAGTTAPKS